MMPRVRLTFATLAAAAIVALCVGLPLLEATGYWDRTLPDTVDETIIVTVALCVGSAIAVVRARGGVALTRSHDRVVLALRSAVRTFVPRLACPAFNTSPPLTRRI
jgi:hypothetical protein